MKKLELIKNLENLPDIDIIIEQDPKRPAGIKEIIYNNDINKIILIRENN